ncbi:MAG TPA: CBS domain-containing protein [Candidatus Saccharimonadia bacterium]|nr:CBS domain-containing protein [Candidatus Saccharimonadia bacterium]
MSLLLILVIFFVSLGLVLITKAYFNLPLYELKRQSREGSKNSKSLYKVASFDFSYKVLQKIVLIVLSSYFFLICATTYKAWLALILMAVYILIIFIYLPTKKVGSISNKLAVLMSKPLVFILSYTTPLVSKLYRSKDVKRYNHTGIYEVSDIYHLVEQQKKQEDSRLEDYQIDILKSVLEFNKQKVSDVMVPKRKVKAISIDEVLGPIVLDELHESGHHCVPVFSDDKDNIVGVIDTNSISSTKHNSPKAGDIMDSKVIYTHEDQDLSQLLQLMVKSNRQLFVVVNSKADYSGIITASDVLKALVGETIADDFSFHEDKTLVSEKFK